VVIEGAPVLEASSTLAASTKKRKPRKGFFLFMLGSLLIFTFDHQPVEELMDRWRAIDRAGFLVKLCSQPPSMRID
jgi:hypothetical protein